MEWVQNVGANETHLVLFVVGLYLVMGMFFDGLSMMVITLPFIVPIMLAAHVDLVWLGVIVCMTVEIGLLTLPVGLNLYVMQGSTGEPLRKVVYGSLPFVWLQICAWHCYVIPAACHFHAAEVVLNRRECGAVRWLIRGMWVDIILRNAIKIYRIET